MGQRFVFVTIWLALALAAGVGCDRKSGDPPATAKPTVASLVPAATDLLLGMGLRDRLVAVSNYDTFRQEIAGLPRVGDYRSVDWEQLSVLRPGVMIVQYAAAKMPAGLQERAGELGIELVNVKIDRLADVYAALERLGEATGEPEAAAGAARQLRESISQTAGRGTGKTVLLSMGDQPLNVIGRETFLDDLLTELGATNAAPAGSPYPTLDREQVLEANPDVVINLIPGGSEQVVDRAKAFWGGMDALPAVREGRVYYLTEPYLLLPGFGLGEVALRFADCVSPPTTGRP